MQLERLVLVDLEVSLDLLVHEAFPVVLVQQVFVDQLDLVVSQAMQGPLGGREHQEGKAPVAWEVGVILSQCSDIPLSSWCA